MYKNQLQELSQRSCFNLPSYTCVREGPDHAPRFKATVNFNGETYECPNYCTTLRQAEHSAAEVALNALANSGPSSSLAARILDETGVYKNLLQEVSQRVGSSLPTYTTFRSGLCHFPVFTCTVELADCIFTGEPAKNKKQAEKNAAMSAWSSLKHMAQQSENSSLPKGNIEEQEHVTVARALQKLRLKVKMSNIPLPIHFPAPKPKLVNTQSTSSTTSKILPFICPKTTRGNRPSLTASNNVQTSMKTEIPIAARSHKFPAVEVVPYIPVRHFRAHHGITPPVTIRNVIPVFSAPPHHPPQFRMPVVRTAPPPVTIRQAVPVFSAPEAAIKAVAANIRPIEEKVNKDPVADLKDPMKLLVTSSPSLTGPADSLQFLMEEKSKVQDSEVVEKLKELQI
ncbi:putative double-stranded RNA-binding domain-containing protein [Helianthus debilis subsp. tardiflorus]